MPRLARRSSPATWAEDGRCHPVIRSVDFFTSSSKAIAQDSWPKTRGPRLVAQDPLQKVIPAAFSTAAATHLFRTRGSLFTDLGANARSDTTCDPTLHYSPRSFFALPPANAATVAASKPSTAAIWPIGSYSAMS